MNAKERILHWQNIIVILFLAAVLAVSFAIGQNEDTKFVGSYENQKLNPWYFTDANSENQETTLPVSYKLVKGEALSMQTTLPDEIPDNYGIMVRTGDCAIEVYAGDELLATYATRQPLPYGRMTGNIRLVVPVPSRYAGQTLTIVQTSYYNFSSNVNEVYFGDLYALKLDVVLTNIWRLILSSGLIIVGIVCLAISLVHMRKRTTENNWSFYHFGLLMFYMACWFICSSDLPQLVTNANGTVSVISFLALSLMPIHVAAFSAESIPDPKDVLRYLQMVEWFNPFLILFGYVTNLWDPVEILPFTHISLVVTILYSIVMGLYYGKRSRSARDIAVANLILIFFLAVTFVFYFKAPTGGTEAAVIGIGMIFYTAYLFARFTAREAQLIADSRTKDIYRDLAYHDMLTGLKNRGAFNEQMDGLEDGEVLVDLIMMDLNYLKVTNDKYGHLAGDQLIVGAAQCIENVFRDHGECYRLGGDEFAVVLLNQHEAVAGYLAQFEREVSLFNNVEEDIQLSVSYGSACGRPGQEQDFQRRLFTRADQAMYEDKKQKHLKKQE